MSGTPRRKPGRLGPHVEGYGEWLAQQGYTPGTVRGMLADLGQVGLWMAREGLETAQLDEAAMVAFLAAARAAGRRKVLGPRAMSPLLRYLRDVGAARVAEPTGAPLEVLLGDYRIWMHQERGLAATTMLRYENTARRFLAQQAMADGVLETAGLTGAGVNAFLLRECGRVSVGSAKLSPDPPIRLCAGRVVTTECPPGTEESILSRERSDRTGGHPLDAILPWLHGRLR